MQASNSEKIHNRTESEWLLKDFWFATASVVILYVIDYKSKSKLFIYSDYNYSATKAMSIRLEPIILLEPSLIFLNRTRFGNLVELYLQLTYYLDRKYKIFIILP